MTDIWLHNSKSRTKERFEPLDPALVGLYVCGPTVYDRAHMGNARPVVVFDVLNRLLRHVYGPDHVRYVRNFTDIDDKIIARAEESGRPIDRITAETTQWFLDDMAELGAMPPDKMPRATEFVPQMVAMIEGLVASGHAYAAEGHVLFAVESDAGYGTLSGRSVDDMVAGARVEVAPYKRNPMDFVLWKPSGDDVPGWDSPWGRGRPGWHIECSAMSYALLGESFDIHGGGNDLLFPHHENECAQSRCAHPKGDFARYWLHNEMLQVEGKKMSKSLGNFFTVRDLLDQNVWGPVIRFVFLSTHYRKPMDWTALKAKEAERELSDWGTYFYGLHDILNAELDASEVDAGVLEALCDDLNSSLALSRLKAMYRAMNNKNIEFVNLPDEEQIAAQRRFRASAELLGIDIRDLVKRAHVEIDKKDLEHFESRLVLERISAMETKDFSKLDRLKSALTEAGVEVRMTKNDIKLVPGAGFDASKLETLE